MTEFLTRNPTETIYLNVIPNWAGNLDNNRTFDETLDEYYRNFSSSINISNEVPTLGDVRGKIFVRGR